jgi:hypothetical protein
VRRNALLAAVLAAACARKRPPAECPAPVAEADAGRRVRTIAEVPPLGTSGDRREVDVPIAWIHLRANPVATGSAPTAVVGANVPCGYRAHWANVARVRDTLQVRLRARWSRDDAPPPATPAPCATPTPTVQDVSLSIVRLGDYTVTDGSQRGPDDAPAPTATLHVVRDDGTLAPAATRWFRPCAHDVDCEGGARCARIGGGAACLPPLDPWQWAGRPCVDGATARPVSAVDAPEVRWTACVAACEGGRCPAGLRCDAIGACVPEATQGSDAGTVSREGAARHGR